jgi:hypothetical protein
LHYQARVLILNPYYTRASFTARIAGPIVKNSS